MKLDVTKPSGQVNTFDLEPGAYTVGRDADCRIQLSHDGVEARHAVLTVHPDGAWIEDLYSESGTQVDGQRIDGRAEVLPAHPITIGPFTLTLSSPTPPPANPTRTLELANPGGAASGGIGEPESASKIGDSLSQGHSISQMELRRAVKQQIHRELVERLDIKRLAASHVQADELQNRARSTIDAIVAEVSHKLPPGFTPARVAKEVYDEALRLGPIEDLLEDEEVTEIMVNGHTQVYVEKAGRLVKTDQMFMDDTSVLAIIERIVSPLGRRIDESQPYVDARLPDGSRVNAIIHPLSLVGPCLTIRKFSKTPFTDQDFVRFGTIEPRMIEFFQICTALRKNIVVSGGTGSGKTSLLNVLSSYLPDSERIVTIEDAAELRMSQQHVIRLESRPPNIEGKGAVAIRDLVRNALRMRPDRIVVGECRGGEALDMLQAMNTGHDGSLTTVHANSPRDVISRLETMVLMSGMDLPIRAIREQISSAIDMIVHEARFSDGSRKVTKVTEVVGQEGDQITMQDIFEYVQTGLGEDGQVEGHFRPTGAVPTFIDDIASRGLSLDRTMFDPLQKGESKGTM